MPVLPGLLARFKSARPQPEITQAARSVMERSENTFLPREERPALLLEDGPEERLLDREPIPAPIPASAQEALIARWREALQTRPNFARGHLRLGIALYDNGEFGEAVFALQKAARLGREAGLSSADCGLACCALGCVLRAQSCSDEETALQAFGKALQFLQTTPDFAPPRLTEGLAHYHAGEYEAAIAALRETLRLSSDFVLLGTDPALAHCGLGCALAAQGAEEREAAFPEFEEAFRLLRQSPSLSQAEISQSAPSPLDLRGNSLPSGTK